MSFSRIFSAALARLIGLVGFMATYAFATANAFNLDYTPSNAQILGGLLLFSFAMTLAFLVPSWHKQIVARTQPIVLRALFILMTAAWALVIWIGLMSLRLMSEARWGIVIDDNSIALAGLGMFVLLGVSIFPGGLAYRSAAQKRPGVNDPFYVPDDEYTEIVDGQPVYRAARAWKDRSADKVAQAEADAGVTFEEAATKTSWYNRGR